MHLRRDLKKKKILDVWERLFQTKAVCLGEIVPDKDQRQRLRGGDLLGVSEEQQRGQDTSSRVAKERVLIAEIREVR